MITLMVAGLIGLWIQSASAAEVVNVEFKFTPFQGDPAKEDQVKTVAGTAHVYLSGVPYADQEVAENEVPVMFEEREIAPSVWVPTASCGPALRKGTNRIRFEFEPTDEGMAYRAQLRWASVLNDSTQTNEEGRSTSTNQTGEGVEEKAGKGKLVMEHEFQADFASDLPWHHYPAMSGLAATDRSALLALVTDRVQAFQPGFAKLYALLKGREGIDPAKVSGSKCLDQAYQAGARIAAPPPEGIEFVLTGGPEVVIRAKTGMLFAPADTSVFERIKDEEVQMCVGAVLSAVYPPHLVAVRSPSGIWEIVY